MFSRWVKQTSSKNKLSKCLHSILTKSTVVHWHCTGHDTTLDTQWQKTHWSSWFTYMTFCKSVYPHVTGMHYFLSRSRVWYWEHDQRRTSFWRVFWDDVFTRMRPRVIRNTPYRSPVFHLHSTVFRVSEFKGNLSVSEMYVFVHSVS